MRLAYHAVPGFGDAVTVEVQPRLRARLHTARAEITRLRAENATLRDQAARHLGEQRAASHHTHPASPP